MLNVLYVTSSSFSGSTFLSFLLNTHPGITTVGEMEGWKNADVDSFRCSCGQVLKSCPFFNALAEAFRQEGLPFAYNNFGTSYQLATNTRLNQYLTGALPVIRCSAAEHLRDAIVTHLPGYSSRIAQTDRSNVVFIRTALARAKAEVFVDVDKNPFRLRYLQRLHDVNLKVIYLFRDLRGVVLTFMENRGWDAAAATRVWLREQVEILRVMQEFPSFLQVSYEDLCEDTDTALAGTYRHLGLAPQPFAGDFRVAEHHILGNSMRLDSVSKVVKSERWKTRLSSADLGTISNIARSFVDRNSNHQLSTILARYLD